MSNEKVKFYRGKEYKNPESGKGEIIMLNAAMGENSETDTNYAVNSKLGSVWQDDKIVGTTRAEQLMTTADITVAGGPLADDLNTWPTDAAWTVDGNKTIPAGTSIQEILEKLFLKEIEGTVKWSAITWNPVYTNKPTAILSNTGAVEVGSTVNANIAANSLVSGNTRKSTLTATYGYFDTIDGTHNPETSVVEQKTGTTSGTTTTSHKWNDVDTTETSLIVKEGTNTLFVTQSGAVASVDALDERTVYASTNTKKVVESVSATLTDTKPADKTLAASTNSATVRGYYKSYCGILATGTEFTNENIKTLESKFLESTSLTFYSSNNLVCNNGDTVVVAVPSTYSLIGVKNAMGNDELPGFSNSPLTYVLPNGTEINYTVYYMNINADNYGSGGLKEFKIEKNNN